MAEDPGLISRLVRALHEHVAVPITCKIRVQETLEKTLDYARMLRASGCQVGEKEQVMERVRVRVSE